MVPITDRLRSAAYSLPSMKSPEESVDCNGEWVPFNVCTEAADEIEKLRNTIQVIGNMWTMDVPHDAVMVFIRPNTNTLPERAIAALRENAKRWSESRPDLPQIVVVPACVDVDVEVKAKEDADDR